MDARFDEFQENEEPTKVSSRVVDRSQASGSGALCGQKVGSFQILSVLGEGGMGTVYLGQQFRPVERKVAIKVARLSHGSSDLVARFRGEQQAIASLDHPEIAKLLDVGTTSAGLPFFAMELINGTPITKFCDINGLTISQRLKLFQRVCSAVGYAHRRGLIHRDLKPSNILVEKVNDEIRLKIIDFGLAKFVESPKGDQSFTLDGQVSGTPRYMSPEQALGLKNRLDIRSDIFSLGVVLFELLTGSTPIPEDDSKGMVQVLKEVGDFESVVPSVRLSAGKSATSDESTKEYDVTEISENRKLNVSSLISTVKGDLDWIVTKATDREQDRRYLSCNDFADDIQRFLKDEPIIARPPSLSYRISKFTKKNRIAVLAASVVAAVLLTSLASGWYLALWALNENEAQRIATKEAIDARQETQAALGVTEKAKERLKITENRAAQSFRVFIESFSSINPMSSGRNLSGADVLMLAYERAKQVLTDDPVGQADLFTALAKSANGVGKNQLAKDLIIDALDVYEEEYGNLAAELLPARAVLLDVLISKREFVVFQMELEKTEKIVKRNNLYDSYFWLKASIQDARVKTYSVDKKVKLEGLERFDSLIQRLRNVEPKYLPEMLAYQSEFAGVHWNGSDLLKDVLKKQQELLGEKHPATIMTQTRILRNNLADGVDHQATLKQEKAIEELVTIYGENHPDILVIKAELAQVFLENFQESKTEQLCLDLIQRFEKSFGPENVYTLRIYNTYVKAVQNGSLRVDTNRIMIEKLRIWKTKYKHLRQDVRFAELLLARSYRLKKNNAKAIELLEKLTMEPNVQDFDHSNVTDEALVELIRIYLNNRKYKKSVELGKTLLGYRNTDRSKAKAHYMLGLGLFHLRNYEKAKFHLNETLKFSQLAFKNRGDVASGRLGVISLGLLGKCYKNEANWKRAVNDLEKAVVLQKKIVKSELPIFRSVDSEFWVKFLDELYYIEMEKSGLGSFDFSKEFAELHQTQEKYLGATDQNTLTTVQRYTLVLAKENEHQLAVEVLNKYMLVLNDAIKNFHGENRGQLKVFCKLKILFSEQLVVAWFRLGDTPKAKKMHLNLIKSYKEAVACCAEDIRNLRALQSKLKDNFRRNSFWSSTFKVQYKELQSLIREKLEALSIDDIQIKNPV